MEENRKKLNVELEIENTMLRNRILRYQRESWKGKQEGKTEGR